MPSDLELPEQIYRSPDQQYLEGWAVQHAKLWQLLYVAGAVILALLVVIAKQAASFTPKVEHVVLGATGFKVVSNADDSLVIKGPDGETHNYRPIQMRAVLDAWVAARVNYDYQNPGKIYDGLALESRELADKETADLQRNNVVVKLASQRRKAKFEADWPSMSVTLQGNGIFRARVGGKLTWTTIDPADPAGGRTIEHHADNLTLDFVLKDISSDPKVEHTIYNRDGYILISVPSETIDLS